MVEVFNCFESGPVLLPFLSHDAHCDASNIWFKAGPGSVPARDLHVLLAGDVNEFAITARCSETDFEYALSELRSLNR
jgi:hypothetical protein